jgi:hypothetical protein
MRAAENTSRQAGNLGAVKGGNGRFIFPLDRMGRIERGLSLIGNLVVLAILAGAGYYLYKTINEVDTGPGCKDALTACMKYCRRSTTDTDAAQACQDVCLRDADACARAAR